MWLTIRPVAFAHSTALDASWPFGAALTVVKASSRNLPASWWMSKAASTSLKLLAIASKSSGSGRIYPLQHLYLARPCHCVFGFSTPQDDRQAIMGAVYWQGALCSCGGSFFTRYGRRAPTRFCHDSTKSGESRHQAL